LPLGRVAPVHGRELLSEAVVEHLLRFELRGCRDITVERASSTAAGADRFLAWLHLPDGHELKHGAETADEAATSLAHEAEVLLDA
jgi:hypothetical protein